MWFWLMAGALSALAVLFLASPLLRRDAVAAADARDALNVEMYQERLAELERQGLDAAQLEQARRDLEKNLAWDLGAAEQQHRGSAPRAVGILTLLLLPTAMFGAYWLSSQDTRQLRTAHAQQQSAQAKAPNMEEIITRLRQRLAEHPEDTEGWRMLGRSMMALERYQEAREAYAKLTALEGGASAENLTDYAESIALTADNALRGEPEALLSRALEMEPEYPKALWLNGMLAVQKQDYPAARTHWQKLLTLLPADSSDRQSVEKYLAQLPGASDAAAQEVEKPAAAAAESAVAVKFQVKVNLADELKDKVKPTQTLFVYAQAAQGPRMPLAIVRRQAAELPLQVSLDDSMGMVAGMHMANFEQIVVLARISESGGAMPQSGDLTGRSEAFNPTLRDTPVEILINEVVP